MLDILIFHSIIIIMLIIDLKLKDDFINTLHGSLIMSIIWIFLSLCFNILIYIQHGSAIARDFFSIYMVEKFLSIDNIFIISITFSCFSIPQKFKRKVLFWGIIGAIIMRALMIIGGMMILQNNSWIYSFMGLFLLFMGLKSIFKEFYKKDDESAEKKSINNEKKILLKIVEYLPIKFSKDPNNGSFFFKKDGLLYFTPLLASMIVIEFADIIFAFDSIPASIGISKDLKIVYSANIMAILGLRSLYFLLERIKDNIQGINITISLILITIAVKMIIDPVYQIDNNILTSFILLLISRHGISYILTCYKAKYK